MPHVPIMNTNTLQQQAQGESPYILSGQDDQGRLLPTTFQLPVPFPLGDGRTIINHNCSDEPASKNGRNFVERSAHRDPVQRGNFNESSFPEVEKHNRSDQMKLTFIMDTVASTTTTASSSGSQQAATSSPNASTAHIDSKLSIQRKNEKGGSSSGSVSPSSGLPPTLVPSQANKRIQACSSCGLVFAVKSKALYHLYTQHPEAAPSKVYPCSRCDNAFLRKSDMTKHYDCVHLRLRPSKCSECPSAFFFRKDLVKHIKTVHEKRRDHV